MLDPYCDRLDYGQILAPDGYSLDFAVGTTYSLDLDSLVSICLSLGLSQETDHYVKQVIRSHFSAKTVRFTCQESIHLSVSFLRRLFIQ